MAFTADHNTPVFPTYQARADAELVLAHESALVAAGAAAQEAAHHHTPAPAHAGHGGRSRTGLKFLRYLFPKRFG